METPEGNAAENRAIERRVQRAPPAQDEILRQTETVQMREEAFHHLGVDHLSGESEIGDTFGMATANAGMTLEFLLDSGKAAGRDLLQDSSGDGVAFREESVDLRIELAVRCQSHHLPLLARDPVKPAEPGELFVEKAETGKAVVFPEEADVSTLVVIARETRYLTKTVGDETDSLFEWATRARVRSMGVVVGKMPEAEAGRVEIVTESESEVRAGFLLLHLHHLHPGDEETGELIRSPAFTPRSVDFLPIEVVDDVAKIEKMMRSPAPAHRSDKVPFGVAVALDQTLDAYDVVGRSPEGSLVLKIPFRGFRKDDLAGFIDDGQRGVVKGRGEPEVKARPFRRLSGNSRRRVESVQGTGPTGDPMGIIVVAQGDLALTGGRMRKGHVELGDYF